MRAVDKGSSPKIYSDYHHARNDLANRLGWFCSYCEMPVQNMIEVEHIHPTQNGGNPIDWQNFLLACRYCNAMKSDRNTSRIGYLWPDRDNTVAAFTYSEAKTIEPANGLSPGIMKMATDTIELMGLDRTPGSGNEPTDRDSRWIARIAVYGMIEESFQDWTECPTIAMARQIARTALGHGFYSLWINRFALVSDVLAEIKAIFPNTHHPVLLPNRTWQLRINGVF